MFLLSLLALASVQTAEATPPPSIMTLTVQKLPKAFQVDPVLTLVFDGKGAVSSCKVAKTSGSPGIDRVACTQVQGNFAETPDAKSASQTRDVTVTFVQEPPKG